MVAATLDRWAGAVAKNRNVAHHPVVTDVVRDGELLERDEASAQLDADLERARLGSGRVALVGGEAGVGKTSLVRSFTSRHEREIRVVWGACEALFTPRPLGPVHDIVRRLEGFTAEQPTTDAERAEYFAALLDELRAHPTIAVFEDVHWADEATLDALKYLGRRIDAAPSLLVLTFRDDEVGANHPLRQVLGDLPTAITTRVSLQPLSVDGVDELARRAEQSARGLHETTGGNPFFVTEVLAGEGGDVPPTVRDAVLARANRLSRGGRRLLDAVAVAPGSLEIWLLEEIAGDDFTHLAECLASGMLIPTPVGVGFRHELGRLAVEHSLPPDRRISLNEKAFQALAAQPAEAQDLSALAHHADAAGNADAVLRFAPAAAARASAVGAHREAAEQYARALSYHAAADHDRLSLLEGYALETTLTGRYAESVEAREEAIVLARALDDRLRLGENLARLPAATIAIGLNEVGGERQRRGDRDPRGASAGQGARCRVWISGVPPDAEPGQRRGRSLGRASARAGARASTTSTSRRSPSTRSACRTSWPARSPRAPVPPAQPRPRARARPPSRVANAYSMLASGLGEMYELEESERWAARVHRLRGGVRPRRRLHPLVARRGPSCTSAAGTRGRRSRRSCSRTRSARSAASQR